jgi:hypothetical protein
MYVYEVGIYGFPGSIPLSAAKIENNRNDLKVSDDGKLVQLLCSWTLSLVQGLIRVDRHNLKSLLALADELCCLGLYTTS